MHITRFPRPLLPPFLFSFFLSQSQKLQVSSAALNVSEGEKGPKKRERSRVGGLESLAPYEGSKRERERELFVGDVAAAACRSDALA